MVRGNNVRGPTSALTEFLRESGINASTIARRSRQGQPADNALNNPDDTSNAAEGSSAQNSGQQDDTTRDQAYDSENLDEAEDETPKKKRKLTKKQTEKLNAKGKAKKNKIDSDSDEEDDVYNALSKNLFNSPRSSKPTVGSFENCAKCEKQFTVTRYTMAANPPPGYLCHDCAKESGANPFKKPSAPRKRKPVEEKRKVVNFEEKTLPSLTSLCINVISKHIDDVEALGDIGVLNLKEIARVLSRNRSLTSNNAPLFYDIKNTSLIFHDATKLDPDGFCALASLNPNLESLRLDLCGRLNDTALSHWSAHFRSLTRIELLGPFLIRVDAWKAFFESHPLLTGFLITQSPRFDLSCMESLAKNCPNLVELRLAQIGKISDDYLPFIEQFEKLQMLDLSDPGKPFSDAPIIALLSKIGAGLTHINLAGNEMLSDSMLIDGLQAHTSSLKSLSLAENFAITTEGIAKFFETTSNPPLIHISLRRNHFLSDEALNALLAHSGSTLESLDINSWKDVSEDSLNAIGTSAPELKKLDIGWCRQVNNFVMKAIIDGCLKLTEINCFGCNRLTDDCPRRNGLSIRGIESHTV